MKLKNGKFRYFFLFTITIYFFISFDSCEKFYNNYHTIDESTKKDKFINMQNSTNSKVNLTKNNDITEIELDYKTKCSQNDNSYQNIILENIKTEDLVEMLKNYDNFFSSSDETTKALIYILEASELDPEKILEKFNVFIKTIIPFIILLLIAILGWITCCSCCCYDYCFFIFKKQEIKNDSTSIRWKLIPIVILIFFTFKSMIPLIKSKNIFKY